MGNEGCSQFITLCCFFLFMFFTYSSMGSHPWDMALHELLHAYFPHERLQNESLPQDAVLQEQNSQGIPSPVSKISSRQTPFCRLQFPAGTLLQHWLSKGWSFRVVICFTVDLHGTVFIMSCRGISTPLSGSPPPSSSSWTLVSAEYYSHISLTPLSKLLLHRSLCPNCLNKKKTLIFLQLFKMSSAMFSIVLMSLQLQPIDCSHSSTRDPDCSCLVRCHNHNPANSIYSCLNLPFFVPHKYPVRKSSINYSVLPFCFF